MLKDQIYLYINESIDERFRDTSKLNNMLDTILNNLIKNVVKIVKTDELCVFNTIFKNITLYCRYYNIIDINDTSQVNIKRWIDLMIMCDIVLVLNLVYLNMINDNLCFKFMTRVRLDGNNCLFLFKMMVCLTDKYYKMLNDCYIEYDLDKELDSGLIRSMSTNLDRFIVGINSELNMDRAIRLYIRTQLDTLKMNNDYITNTVISILDRSSRISTDGLREELIKNNSALADDLINKISY